MDQIEKIFSYYDKLISGLTPSQQGFVSLALLIFLIWQIYTILRNGHWIFIVLLVLFLPGTWPAAKHIGEIIIHVIQFLWQKSSGVV